MSQGGECLICRVPPSSDPNVKWWRSAGVKAASSIFVITAGNALEIRAEGQQELVMTLRVGQTSELPTDKTLQWPRGLVFMWYRKTIVSA